jgi:alpha-glucosidase
MLQLYRDALRIRRAHPALGDGELGWLDTSDGTLRFARQPGFVCLVNVSAQPTPSGAGVPLASGPLSGDGRWPAGTALWLSG